ncbi:MAG: MoxR family ATPase [Clostridia bacterium]|nr:MoxR family ATPase [Clostridia bacterium]
MTSLTDLASSIRQNVALALVGKEEATDLLLIALLCEGHVLIEDVPGVGKTTLASALARSLSCSFARVQFTPDVTPSDLTGFSIPDGHGELRYRPGAVAAQVVLADEINRTSPKTQAALLEIMEEKQATVDGVTHPMPRPFMVMATQNPVDFVGTYPLPEAQMDRFLLRVSIGYPTARDEADILLRYSGPEIPMEAVAPVCSAQDILDAQAAVRTVYVSYEVRAYIVALCDATRKTDLLALGASTRAAIALCRAAQARALLCGRDYVIPEDVQALAVCVLAHRLVLSADARMRGETTADVTRQLLSVVRVPVKLK